MTVIFDSGVGQEANAGQVVLLQPTAGVGSLLQVDGWGGFTLFKSIFTNISFRETPSFQFQHMLGNRIYLNSFGDRIGQLQLAGMAFFDNCGLSGRLQRGRAQRLGISHVLEYYRNNKLTVRGAPVRIAIDPVTVYEGYLTGFQGDMLGEQHNMHRLYQFSLSFATLPPTLTGRQIQLANGNQP